MVEMATWWFILLVTSADPSLRIISLVLLGSGVRSDFGIYEANMELKVYHKSADALFLMLILNM